MNPRAFLFFVLLLSSTPGLPAVPGDPDDVLTFLGSRPIYANGGKPNVIVDDFGWLDNTRTDQELDQIAATIEEWSEAGIQYGAYYALGVVESEAGAAALGDAGRLVDLDGSHGSWFMFTRSAFREYLINAGKTAVDLGATYFFLDNASPNLETLSFDDEIIAAFRTYLEANYTPGELTAMGVGDSATFDYRDYLKSAPGGGYTDSESVNSNPPTGELWEAWIKNMQSAERSFFEEWTSSIKTYSQTEYSRTVYFGGNRYAGARQWDNIDKMDFGIAETFLDSLGYPYYNLDHINKNIRNFDKRFWSWGFPANTGSLNGSNDPYGMLHITELSKVFLAETLSSGGLHQIPIDWVSYHNNNNRLAPLAPYYAFARNHSELFNLDDAGEMAVVYNEASEISDDSNFTPGYQGIMMLLGDAHRPFDVLFAGTPDKRDGADPFDSSDLSKYKALVLPNTRQLTDAQVSKLESYLSGGGVVIGLGQIADLDEAGNDVSGSRTFDDHFLSDGSTTIGSGEAICFTTNLGDNYHGDAATSSGESSWEVTAGNLSSLATHQTTWSTAVDSIVDKDFSGSLSRLVHVHRYKDPVDGSQVYQMVNRDITMTENVDDQTINATSAVACSVRIPDGFNSSTAKLSWMTVEAPAPLELAATVNGDFLDFTLPSFSVWGILKVGSVAASPDAIDETPEAVFDLRADTGGHRPDTLNDAGAIAYNYWYWKGGNHGSIPWDIPYLATDDGEVDLVRLFYRFSADQETWGDWSLHSTADVSGSNVSGTVPFDAPDGQGYYQMRIQAVDDLGQEEVVLASRDGTAYGVDSTAPLPPANVTEASHESGTWIADPSGLVFTWDAPKDNLSGYLQANVSVGSDSETITETTLGQNDLGWSPTLNGLTAGERYKLNFRHEDEAGNWAGTVSLFSFRYGTLPVGDLENVAVTEGDGKLTVSWTNPSDVNYNHAAFSFRVAGDPYGNWIGAGLSPDSSTTTHEITGLTNGVTYQVLAIAVSNSGEDGNEILVPGTYTPEEGLGGGGDPKPLEAPANLIAQDNTHNIRLEWTDNATDETGNVIEYKLKSSETWNVIATIGPNAVAFVHNINIGTDQYEYRVKAIRDSESSEYSNVAGVARSGGGGNPDIPLAPTELSAADNQGKVDLQWNDNSNNETGFILERRKQGVQLWNHLITLNSNETAYQDPLDIGADTFEYRIKAVNGGQNSLFSNVASVTRSGGGGGEPQIPLAPSNLSAKDSSAKVELQWDDNSGDETGFVIERRIHGNADWTQIAVVNPNETAYQDPLDIGADTFEYRIKAVNGGGSSAFSNEASVTRHDPDGNELNLTAIIAGHADLDIRIENTKTIGFLQEFIASQIQVASQSLEIYLGSDQLSVPELSLEAAGFIEEGQFTVLITGLADSDSYAAWQLVLFGDEPGERAGEEDMNQDGIPNLVHYVLGTDPVAEFNTGNPVSVVAQPDSCDIYYRRKKSSANSCVLEVSLDSMKTWQIAGDLGMTESVEDGPEEGYEWVCWTLPDNPPSNLLVRLRVTLN